MTVMTDEAAKQIALKTMKKFEDADRKAILVTMSDKDYTVYRTEDAKLEDIIEAFVNVLYGISPSDKAFVNNMKLITKIAKKERRENAKCKKRA